MKKFAVGHYDQSENVLTVEIVEANSWRDAASKHTKIGKEYDFSECQDLEEAKEEMFDSDQGLDVVEIK